jgi:hypothetical protein
LRSGIRKKTILDLDPWISDPDSQLCKYEVP